MLVLFHTGTGGAVGDPLGRKARANHHHAHGHQNTREDAHAEQLPGQCQPQRGDGGGQGGGDAQRQEDHGARGQLAETEQQRDD